MEKDLIGAMSWTHELKWNEIFKFACSGPRPLVATLCRLGERPVLADCCVCYAKTVVGGFATNPRSTSPLNPTASYKP